jgi:glycosyltransferase involved in cell wall biosynthesis
MIEGIQRPQTKSLLYTVPRNPVMSKLSVIIPAYNEEKYLPATLEHIGKALTRLSGPSEIIVVDNDSNDGTRRVAEAFGATVFAETQRNIAKARNTGAENSTGDILVFVDADTLVPDTLFQRIIKVMEDKNCFGGAVAVRYANPQRRWIKVYLLGWKFWGTVFNMKQGAAQFCRKSIFEQLGGYDPGVFVGEDVEFYWRLARLAKQRAGYLNFIKEPQVTTSARRFDHLSICKTLLLTNPVFIYLAWRRKSFWKDWYEKEFR